jgi:tetratricopeptide (TPR) repeat protein
MEPSDVSLYLVSSQLLMDGGRVDEAVSVLEEARTWAPESAPVESQMGLVRLRRGETGLALEAFRKATALEPDNPEHHNRLALGLSQAREGDCGLRRSKGLELCRMRPPPRQPRDGAPRPGERQSGTAYRRAVARAVAPSTSSTLASPSPEGATRERERKGERCVGPGSPTSRDGWPII